MGSVTRPITAEGDRYGDSILAAALFTGKRQGGISPRCKPHSGRRQLGRSASALVRKKKAASSVLPTASASNAGLASVVGDVVRDGEDVILGLA